MVAVDNDPPGTRRPIAAVVGQARTLFELRVVHEPEPGLSAGRNRGICAARGRYIAVTDPDITPDPDWLATLVDTADTEGVFAVGGRTTVDYAEGTAIPLTKALAECHGAVDWPADRTPARFPFWVTGCNLLFDRQRALELGLFRRDLGRKRGRLLDCEDLEFVDRAREAGLETLIEPAAHARHPVYRTETTLRWFVRQGIGHGVCVARMHDSVTVVPEAIRADRGAAKQALVALVQGWTFLDSAAATEALRDLVRIVAYHAELRRLRWRRCSAAYRHTAPRVPTWTTVVVEAPRIPNPTSSQGVPA